MEFILKQMINDEKNNKVEENFRGEKDEVSISYYGENCSFSKTAKCKSSKCLCFLRDEKCTPEYHDGKTNCTNK